MSARLEGKTAIVTGGARGIGRAIAERFAAEGATVCVADLLADEASALAATLGGSSFAVRLDVTSIPSIQAMVAEVVQHRGGIDILVNNAAVFDLAPIVEVTEKS